MALEVKHKIEFAKHPNGRDYVITCACGFKAPAHNQKDALRIARIHIEGEARKNEHQSSQ